LVVVAFGGGRGLFGGSLDGGFLGLRLGLARAARLLRLFGRGLFFKGGGRFDDFRFGGGFCCLRFDGGRSLFGSGRGLGRFRIAGKVARGLDRFDIVVATVLFGLGPQERLTVGKRDLVVVRVDFGKGQEA